MRIEQVSKSCYAVLNDKNRLCDSNSGLVNCGGGLLVDTQCDLAHAREMIRLFGEVWPNLPERVVNTHEDADHVWGNQLFPDAEIIAHRTAPERMREVADPAAPTRLMRACNSWLSRWILRATKPGLLAVGQQLNEDYDFSDIQLTLPTKLFDDRLELVLEDLPVQLVYVGPGHQLSDTMVWVPDEGVLFAGDVVFQQCTPMGWRGTFAKWIESLDLIVAWNPDIVVPGHGPVCGVDGVLELKAYLQYVYGEAKRCFDAGRSSLDAAKQIDLGPYAHWRAPARLFMNVERAYREFRGDPVDAGWDTATVFQSIYRVAQAQGTSLEF